MNATDGAFEIVLRHPAVGYPTGRFGPVRRAPLADAVFEDRIDQPSSASPA